LLKIIQKASTQKIRECSIAQGMTTLQKEAGKLVIGGITTLREIDSSIGAC
jgi:type II secretory ATPase GspE/PulE/Tfp pilus assembly ATPase PilB-like protein